GARGADIHVLSGGLFVYSGGSLSHVTVDPGGREIIAFIAGGKTASGVAAAAGYNQIVYGTVIDKRIVVSGVQTIEASGTSIRAVISGQQTVDGQPISGLVTHRGLQSVESG